ncbi:metallophosphoesterase [Novosphingobium soli]|uniref:Metallophosphoesterase n=1 Tax=Novosphingobium soli TaxID=574956 RepID=A0ABV6CU64_9SPHN
MGDIHGRLDLFEQLLQTIDADDARRPRAQTTIILLGDLVDRGLESAAVVARARRLERERNVELIQGNHEEMMLVGREDPEALRGFLRFGGMETLLSYGIDKAVLLSGDIEDVQRRMNAAIPEEDFAFLGRFKKMVRIGDYAFVHAGVRPDMPLEHQMGRDCRWIREPFLSHRGDFGAFVIHGHTITPEPDVCENRIGIDTGAFIHGTLTAIGLEGTDRWFLQAHEDQLSRKVG